MPPTAAASIILRNEESGRPWLENAPTGLTVALSHSGEWVAALLNQGGRAGVDIELIRDKARRIARKFLADDELTAAEAAAAGTDAIAHYSLLWSAKETLYKLAARRGIIFRQQLLLAPFTPQASGEIAATLVLAGQQTRHRICYCQPAPGYVLTYSHEPASSEPGVLEF
jgi:4'-phosphopantetheinyl transferase